jgi:thiamine biosynthesis protein ThiS
MRVHVNGEAREIAPGATVTSLLTAMKIDTGQVAVEINALVVRRSLHAEVQLQPGDQIEIVTFVGGG